MSFKAASANLAKRLLAHTPFRVVRRGLGHRFQAIDDLLANIKARGYVPAVVIDGGANIGDFARLARRTWTQAWIIMVEPQPACEPALRALAADGGFEVVMAALGREPGVLRFAATADTTSTGAHVIDRDGDADTVAIEVPVTTLAGLIDRYADVGPIFLKLDLQGYELHALHGAGSALDHVDAVLTEASFYAQAYEPSIDALISFLNDRGFDLHDIGALAGRPRDGRARQADLLFVRRDARLAMDTSWA
jgi:FkbM family methyltransferase